MDIAKIDKNFANTYSFEGLETYNINDAPFQLYGLCREAGETDFKRLPHKLMKELNLPGVQTLYTHTAGIRVRFRTDSARIVLSAVLPNLHPMSHMPLAGSMGFDLYADGAYCGILRPDANIVANGEASWNEESRFSSGYTFPDKKEREILINFPLYNNVKEVYISLEKGASLAPAREYAIQKPIVYYGSSITQGGCASHPGNHYCAMISRRLDADFINLGFSGSCRAERELADYIGKLDMSAFVYDYDYNAPTIAHLQNTHEEFFKRFRTYQPKTPVIMISKANVTVDPETTARRREIIRKTWENAREAGDENVYFIDGTDIYKDVGEDSCTVDGVHPNDLGFWAMANTVGKILAEIVASDNFS